MLHALPPRFLQPLTVRHYEAQARLDPVYSGTPIGDNRFDDALPITIAPRHRQRRFAMHRDARRQLARIPRERLGPADALTHDLLASNCADGGASNPSAITCCRCSTWMPCRGCLAHIERWIAAQM